MSMKHQIKLFQRTLARWGVFTCIWLVEHLPFSVVRAVVRSLIAAAFQLARRHWAVARESVRLALGKEKTPDEQEAIIRQCFANIREASVELFYYSRYPQRVTSAYTIDGREHLDRALAQGRGVIAVTAHFGNFPAMMLALAQYGYKVNCIMRRLRDEKVGAYVFKTMQRTGVTTIYTHPRRECVHETLRALRNNEIVFILMDQHFGRDGGILVDFFGRTAATATGPVIFADRSKAPILPVFNIGEEGGRRRIFIEPPMAMEESPDHDDMIRKNVIRLTRVIEEYIRRYPAEWGWMHRRWKIQDQAVPSG